MARVQRQPFPFLSLPIEIQDIILELALKSKNTIKPRYWGIAHKRVFGVFLSCKELYAKGLNDFLRGNTISCVMRYRKVELVSGQALNRQAEEELAGTSLLTGPDDLLTPRGLPPVLWRSMITHLEILVNHFSFTDPYRLGLNAWLAPLRVLERAGFRKWDPHSGRGLQTVKITFDDKVPNTRNKAIDALVEVRNTGIAEEVRLLGPKWLQVSLDMLESTQETKEWQFVEFNIQKGAE